jgi:hypothetical protein
MLAEVKNAVWISAAADIQSVDWHKIDRAKSALMKEAKKNSKEALKDVFAYFLMGGRTTQKCSQRVRWSIISAGYKGKALFSLQ